MYVQKYGRGSNTKFCARSLRPSFRDSLDDVRLEQGASLRFLLGCRDFVLLLAFRVQNRSDRGIEQLLEASLGESGALEVTFGSDLLGKCLTLLGRDRAPPAFGELAQHSGILAQVGLGSDKDLGYVGAVVADLGAPLQAHILIRRREHHRVADQKDVGLGIAERAKSVVFFLPGCIPQPQVDNLAVHHHVGRVVVEDCWKIFARKSVGSVGDKEAGFANGSVTYYDCFDRSMSCHVLLVGCCVAFEFVHF